MSSLEKLLSQSPRMMPLVVLLCGLLATAGAWYGLRASQQSAAELHFQQLTGEVVDAIEKRMSNHRQILLGGLACSKPVTRLVVKTGGTMCSALTWTLTILVSRGWALAS